MSIRTERLGAVIQRDLGTIIQRQYQKSGTFITVTAVRLTEDLMIAKVFISIYAPGRDEDAIYNHLEEHKAAIRKELASKIRHQVRKIPELHFQKDETAEYVDKMENLFEKIRKEREERNNDEQE
ncbi:30S ribosome-binding factor RbfA [Aliifodinibius sp. S!AR15-10]|uniref:30S ribosome-binding factor RbfA n=1 Tax=Aliifodinibius sp. S!AR15-10 TaxID=2950437 RepID=UPI0028643CCC|nr:30S ribosome-binding factor RbfA [Aliifodinibius sp. S!AR15-10]MDR8391546.1 30S ribosome-binding factor RbfA [Aliifodinibius sp. S!AR15-10]